MSDPKLVIATRNTLERLQRRGHFPAAQAALVQAALDEWQRNKAPESSVANKDKRGTPTPRLTRSSAKRQARELEAETSRGLGGGSAESPSGSSAHSDDASRSRWNEELPGPVASILWNALEANKDAACARLVCRQWSRMITSQTREMWLAVRPSRLLRAWGHCMVDRFPALQNLHVEIDDSSLPKYTLEDREVAELWDDQDTPARLLGALASLPRLTHLKCHSSLLTDEHLKEMAKITGLQKLMITFHERHNNDEDDLEHPPEEDPPSSVTTTGLSALLDLPSLAVLHLVQCPPTLESDTWLQDLPKMTALKDLVITHYEVLKDETIDRLATGMPQLTSLELSWCVGITNRAVESLKSLTALQTLRITGDEDSFEPGWIDHVAAVPSLVTLLITDRAALRDEELSGLHRLKALTSLNLNGCPELTDAALEHITKLSGLRELSLSGLNGLTNAGLARLAGLRCLRVFGLQHCRSVVNTSFCNKLPRSLTHFVLLHNDIRRTRDLAGLSGLPRGLEALYITSPTMAGPGESVAVLAALRKALKHLSSITHLTLSGFKGLEVEDVLLTLTPLAKLAELSLPMCTGITREGCNEIVSRHPNSPSVHLDAVGYAA